MSRHAHNLSSASSSFVVTVILALAAVFAVIGAPAFGGTISLSNLNSGSSTAGFLAVGQPDIALAQGFTTGSNTEFLKLTQIKLDLIPDTARATNSPLVQLWSNIGSGGADLPSSSLATFTVQPALPGGIPFNSAASVYTFVGSFDLQPNTNYWVVVRDASPTVGKFGWDFNNTFATPSARTSNSGFTSLAGARSTSNGSTWSQNAAARSLAVELVAVPEPPTIILAGLGAAAVVGHGYRRRRLRQRGVDGSEGEWTAQEGAIALTA